MQFGLPVASRVYVSEWKMVQVTTYSPFIYTLISFVPEDTCSIYIMDFSWVIKDKISKNQYFLWKERIDGKIYIANTGCSEMNAMVRKSVCFGLLRSMKEKLLESKAKTIRSHSLTR